MLRVLLALLAVVSIVLAVVLARPELYGVAVLCVAGAVILTTLGMKRRHRDVPEIYSELPEREDDDLSSLGIMEIKPKASSPDRKPSGGRAPVDMHVSGGDVRVGTAPPEDDAPADVVARDTSGTSSTESAPREGSLGKARTRPPRVRIMVSEASTPQQADILIPAFRSLRASIDAYTVCLLRQENGTLRYHVEVMVSQNSYARSGGSFSVSDPLLAGNRALVPVVYPRVGPNGFAKNKLGYYHEPIAVRQVAMVPVVPKKHDDLFILVVDTVSDGGLEAASVRVLLEQYARLVTAILDTAADGGLAESRVDNTKPRRDIISEEMERSRTLGHPLSLALVFLNKGESLAGDDRESRVAELEIAFEGRLREVAIDARIERFGELTFGVFYHGARQNVAAWASRIQDAFRGDEPDSMGGVSVGVVVYGPRHESPDDLRSHATAALQEAFETGECTIVE
jgi:GGDEF domain-containing protein